MRSDLPLGVLAAQLLHAVGESARGLEPGAHAVVLSVRGEDELLRVADKLSSRGVRHVLFREPDPPWHGAATAIGLFPVRDRSTVRKLLGGLPLLGGEPWRST